MPVFMRGSTSAYLLSKVRAAAFNPMPSVRALTTCQITLTGVFTPAMRVFFVSEK